MSANYPVSLDDSASLPNPGANDFTDSPNHAEIHSTGQDAIKALEAKVGTGATTPASNKVLLGTGSGTSAWQGLTSSELRGVLSDETGTGSAVFATSPTLVTPAVDTIGESTPANGVTIDSLNIKDGKLNTDNSVVTANITASAITTAKINDAAVTPPKWTNPYKFSVYRNAAWNYSSSPAKVQFDTELFDSNNNFDNATNYRYTAPVDGFYQFNAAAGGASSGTADTSIYLYKNGSVVNRGTRMAMTTTFSYTMLVSSLIQLTAGDYIEVYFECGSGASTGVTGSSETWFNGFLMSQT